MSVAIARGWRRLYFERKYTAFCNTLVTAERDSLRARLAAAEKEVERLKAENCGLRAEADLSREIRERQSVRFAAAEKEAMALKAGKRIWYTKARELLAESKRLREALIDYGNHYETCPHYGKIRQQDVEGVKCTCGFTAALRDSAKEKV